MLNSRRLPALLFAAAAVVGGCGTDRSGGPRGDPTAIVSGAADRTVAARSAKVTVGTPTATADGSVDFTTGQAKMRVAPRSAPEPELTGPLLALDVVRAAVSVRPFGGAEVRGASTIKYELDVAPSPELLERLGGGLRGDTFYADVAIDARRRIRRVTIPIDLNERRPSDRNKILAKLITIDFYDFPA
ncbi:MAG: hypothetical protein H0W70_12820 [Actinobacteria bacterium]|nr:hypothetical protein [Actinomycetota bacterium]